MVSYVVCVSLSLSLSLSSYTVPPPPASQLSHVCVVQRDTACAAHVTSLREDDTFTEIERVCVCARVCARHDAVCRRSAAARVSADASPGEAVVAGLCVFMFDKETPALTFTFIQTFSLKALELDYYLSYAALNIYANILSK